MLLLLLLGLLSVLIFVWLGLGCGALLFRFAVAQPCLCLLQGCSGARPSAEGVEGRRLACRDQGLCCAPSAPSGCLLPKWEAQEQPSLSCPRPPCWSSSRTYTAPLPFLRLCSANRAPSLGRQPHYHLQHRAEFMHSEENDNQLHVWNWLVGKTPDFFFPPLNDSDHINALFAKMSVLCDRLSLGTCELSKFLIFPSAPSFPAHLPLMRICWCLHDLHVVCHQSSLEKVFPASKCKQGFIYLSPWAAHAVSHQLWPGEHFGYHHCLPLAGAAMWSAGIALPGGWGLQAAELFHKSITQGC